MTILNDERDGPLRVILVLVLEGFHMVYSISFLRPSFLAKPLRKKDLRKCKALIKYR